MNRRILAFLMLVSSIGFPSLLRAQEPEKSEPSPLQDPFEFKFRNGASLKLYGRFEMLTYYDTTSPAVSDWLVYVNPKGTIAGDEDSISMSVRGSPFGLAFTKPAFVGTAALNAKLEMDFVGGFTTGANSAYSPLVRLKQAWFSLNGEHLGVLVGQTFGVFGPLFPDIGSWITLGTSGNPWIRLPQIRFTADYAPVKLELSVDRPMGANEIRANSIDDIISDGEQSNVPFMMGRLGFSKKAGSIALDTGASGVYGREKIRRSDPTAGISVDKTLPVWMGVYDLLVSSKYVDFKGEFFAGSNVNSFYAGVYQGVNISATSATAIKTMGGWGQITLKPVESWYFNFGAGIDNPWNSDLAAGTQRSSNFTGYANANYRVTPTLVVMAEPSYTRTGYKDGTTNDNIRALLKTTLSF